MLDRHCLLQFWNRDNAVEARKVVQEGTFCSEWCETHPDKAE